MEPGLRGPGCTGRHLVHQARVGDQLSSVAAGAAGLTFFTSALPPQGWTPRTEVALAGSLGQAWQRGDQRLTVALVEVGTSTIAVVLLSTPR